MNFDLLWVAPAGSVLALCFAAYLIFTIVKRPAGTDKMVKISDAIRRGSNAYIKRQYCVVSIFFAVTFVILMLLVRGGYLPIYVPFAFLSGGFFSGLAGFIGMKVATIANVRTTQGAIEGLNAGLRVAFSSGAVMGLVVVGLGLLDLSIWYYLLDYFYRALPEAEKMQNITSTMLCFGMGASFMALFARVGGGIFTKAADMGADLVGKIEANIPEDDPRNAAVVADNVGDNVGDVAGMGADLYESYVGSIVATMMLAVSAGLGVNGVTVPLVMAAIGVVCSIIGTFFVHAKEDVSQDALLSALRRGIFISAILVAIGAFFAVKFILGMEHIGVYWAILSGLLCGITIGLSTEYFTSQKYRPAQNIAASTETGPAMLILGGMATGMFSTAIPVIAVAIAVLASYYLSGGAQNFSMGLYGVGISAVGMLSTLGITLASDAYGPVADNAGGIAEMSGQEPIVRERTDALDALGNTTAATGKGFAIGSAALTALALIAAYRDEVYLLGREIDLTLLNPRLIAGLFIGAMLPLLFCSFIIESVKRAASKIVAEVRRQFREIPGLMEGKAEAEYAHCVNICTASAQKEMILPSMVAILAPILVGLLLNVEAVVGLLAGALSCGFVMAISMANSGGVWDNAKKYIESGAYGGKGSPAHKSGIIGDTIGDPLKDAAGPSLNILIKLMSMVSVVFASFIIANALVK